MTKMTSATRRGAARRGRRRSEGLPRPEGELEQLADYYGTHDTADDMGEGQWVNPRPMVTISLRISESILSAIKEEAARRGIRHTTLIRQILTEHVDRTEAEQPEEKLADILARLDRIESKISA